jgi:hypothetical protein
MVFDEDILLLKNVEIQLCREIQIYTTRYAELVVQMRPATTLVVSLVVSCGHLAAVRSVTASIGQTFPPTPHHQPSSKRRQSTPIKD